MNISSSKKYKSYRKIERFWFWNRIYNITDWADSHCFLAFLWWCAWCLRNQDVWFTLMVLFDILASIVVGVNGLAMIFNAIEGKTWNLLSRPLCDKYVKIIEKYFFKDLEKALVTKDIEGIADLLTDYGQMEKIFSHQENMKLTLSKTFEEVYKNALNTVTESKEYEDLTIALLIKAGTEHKGFDNYTESKTLKERYSKEYMRDTYPRLKRTYDETYVDLTKCDFWKDYTEYFKHMHLADIDATAYMLENRYKYLKEHRVDNLEWTYSHILHPAMRIEDYTMTKGEDFEGLKDA